MLAYNKDDLTALIVRENTNDWQEQGWGDAQLHQSIHEKFPLKFYSPNLFVRIGLFIFGNICISSAISFFFLLSSIGSHSSEISIFIRLSICSVILFFVLEKLLRGNKPYYCAGLEEALLYSALGCFFFGMITLVGDLAKDNIWLMVLFISVGCAIAAIRYIDSLLAIGAYGGLLYVLFDRSCAMGELAKSLLPFIAIAFAALMERGSHKLLKAEKFIYWEAIFTRLRFISLLLFYLGGNYFVVRELSVMVFQHAISAGENIPLAWVFYVFTVIIPLVYIVLGLIKKDRLVFWCSLLTLGFTVFTFKYYYNLGHPEITLTSAGLLLLFTASMTLKFFKNPRYGISTSLPPTKNKDGLLNMEALAVSASFAANSSGPSNPPNFKGQGGQFGGGGASGSY